MEQKEEPFVDESPIQKESKKKNKLEINMSPSERRRNRLEERKGAK